MRTEPRVAILRKLEDCTAPSTSANAGIAFAFTLSFNGNMICASGVGDFGSTSAIVQMPNFDMITFNIACQDHYTNGFSDFGVGITSGGAYRVLNYDIVEANSLFSFNSCNPCQFQDSHYQDFCSGTSSVSAPIPAPTQAPATTTENPSVSSFVSQARSDIVNLISSNPLLAPKFIRMGFHDCVGSCDGCIDLSNADNNGLDIPISALDSIVQKYTVQQSTGLSRADIWALAALTSADISQGSTRVDMPFSWFGRVDCQGSATGGPQRVLPSPDVTTAEILNYFSSNFGFNEEQTVALMGAHTLGASHRQNTGFNGQWVSQNLVLSNSYYQNLVGGSSGLFDSEATMATTSNWTDNLIINSDLSGIPDRWQWEQNGLIMLNADIALVRDFQGQIDSLGKVSCPFVASSSGGPSACPFASVTGIFVAQYKNDNLLWLNDFRDVFSSMLVNGYDTSVSCGDSICQL